MIQYGLKYWYRGKITSAEEPHKEKIWWVGFLFNIIVNIQNEVLFATAKRYFFL
jgi:hypothetical protein